MIDLIRALDASLVAAALIVALILTVAFFALGILLYLLSDYFKDVP